MKAIEKGIIISAEVEIPAAGQDTIQSAEVVLPDFGDRSAVVVEKCFAQVLSTTGNVSIADDIYGFSALLAAEDPASGSAKLHEVPKLVAIAQRSVIMDISIGGLPPLTLDSNLHIWSEKPARELWAGASLWGAILGVSVITVRFMIQYGAYTLTTSEYVDTI